jgi:DNA-binding beta-propeller fold protein YncE
MAIKQSLLVSLGTAAVLAAAGINSVAAAPFLIIGNDEKVLWDDKSNPIISPSGKDTVVILDLADPENPKTVASLQLKNSVAGPPVNLAIDPTNSIALVADSMDVTKDGDKYKMGFDNKLYVIDLRANPAKLANTVTVGKQPSGLSISPSGKLAMVTNRADKSISVLSINGTDVKVTDTIDMGGPVSQVVFTPDGKRAVATKFNDHKLAILDVNGDKITYNNKLDLPTGQWPYNVVVSPNGKLALTADNGGAGSSDGSVDTVSVVDLSLDPPRITDRVVVGDGPEGLAMSPKGNLAVAIILAGSNMKNAYYYHKNGSVSVLKIAGNEVTKVGSVEVGGLPEGAQFSPDGKYLYVGNYLDEDLSILKVSGTKLKLVKRMKLGGHPASLRMSVK